jgi:hypothetical protein
MRLPGNPLAIRGHRSNGLTQRILFVSLLPALLSAAFDRDNRRIEQVYRLKDERMCVRTTPAHQ